MDHDESSRRRLRSIDTLWSVVERAHGADGGAARRARHELIARYGGAIRRYLMASLRDPSAVEELSQDFALRFLNGDFRHADPGRGRFRDYVKTSIYHLIIAHGNRARRQAKPLPGDHAGPAVPPCEADLDRAFAESWRDEILARTWETLAASEAAGGPPHHAVLKFRADHPELGSAEMARRLGERLGRPLSAAGVRQILHRSREQFAGLLLDEVADSLNDASVDRLEEELIALGLLEYCRDSLKRRRGD